MIQLFERLKKLTSGGEKAKLDSSLCASKLELLKPRLDEKEVLADLIRSTSETASILKTCY